MTTPASFPHSTRSSARRRLLQYMAAGVAGGASGLLQQVLAAEPSSVEQGIRRVHGTVLVNGDPARVGVIVPPGATVITEGAAEAAYVVGQDAYLQRGDTHVRMGRGAASAMRIVTGALMSVFGRSAQRTIATRVITAGIRGTGCYVEAGKTKTYFCLCYGTVDLTPTGGVLRSYSTRHHDSPYWIDESGNVTPAEMLNHEDTELALLESIVGRQVPFSVPYTR